MFASISTAPANPFDTQCQPEQYPPPPPIPPAPQTANNTNEQQHQQQPVHPKNGAPSNKHLHLSHISSFLSSSQQDKLKGWLHTVRKKTARLSTRITASLGLISLTRDEEFERHYDNFKLIKKTIKAFIKDLSSFVEHFESFSLALQGTSDNLAEFYRDKAHKKEFEELKRKNKVLTCEHFHAFKRTVERQVIAVLNQLLQKFAAPHQLINKRSAKLLDYDNRSKELESCRDQEKRTVLRDHYVIAKDLYDKINRQLLLELPTFNQLSLKIFEGCIMVLLQVRRDLISSYTELMNDLLNTPLMMTYTASDVAAGILNSCQDNEHYDQLQRQKVDIHQVNDLDYKDSGRTSSRDMRLSSVIDDDESRPLSALSLELNRMNIEVREITSTPLSQVSEFNSANDQKYDEPDAGLGTSDGLEIIKGTNMAETHSEAPHSEDCTVVRQNISKERKKKKPQIYIALWPFASTGPNQLTITTNQPLKLVKGSDECGNSDWSLVQDKKGQLGYVPSSYIKKRE